MSTNGLSIIRYQKVLTTIDLILKFRCFVHPIASVACQSYISSLNFLSPVFVFMQIDGPAPLYVYVLPLQTNLEAFSSLRGKLHNLFGAFRFPQIHFSDQLLPFHILLLFYLDVACLVLVFFCLKK